MIEQVVEAWMIDKRVNPRLLDNLDRAALECTLSMPVISAPNE